MTTAASGSDNSQIAPVLGMLVDTNLRVVDADWWGLPSEPAFSVAMSFEGLVRSHFQAPSRSTPGTH
ncbi:MAG: hypothetical protein ACR2GA_00420 [Chloroflexota bacterium]